MKDEDHRAWALYRRSSIAVAALGHHTIFFFACWLLVKEVEMCSSSGVAWL